ncbi:MAG: hypothetical protein JWO97_3486 [Acidobacteria bacterium]|nr:hypothetical protein [Acidobacteriota bacterium]
MKKTFATTLLVIVLATPAFAAVKGDPDRGAGDRTVITRVMKLLKRFVGITSQDDIIIPRPKP